tara:strand:- start:28 stop:426 length:399 start_codon:yes stop_codon:yes gene_type:complete
MKIKGVKEYFDDFWNITDLLSFGFNVWYFFMRIADTKTGTLLFQLDENWMFPNFANPRHPTEFNKLMILLNCIVIIFSLIKMLSFMKTFETTQLLTILVIQVTKDLGVLLCFWFLWVIFFALQSAVLGSDYD